MNPDDRRTMYDQEWETYRYQDSLRWSRIQTIALVEGAVLYALSSGPAWLSGIEFVAVGSILVFLVSLLAVKDGYDAVFHLNRALELGKPMGLPLGGPGGFARYIKGRYIMTAAIVLVNLFNLYLLFGRPWTREVPNITRERPGGEQVAPRETPGPAAQPER